MQGFAFFLGLSTLLDVFITYFFTRPLVILLGRSARITEARIMGVAARPGRRIGGGSMTTVDEAAGAERRAAPNALVRLYRGETSFDFVGRRRWWFLALGHHHRRRADLARHPRASTSGSTSRAGRRGRSRPTGCPQAPRSQNAVEAAGLTGRDRRDPRRQDRSRSQADLNGAAGGQAGQRSRRRSQAALAAVGHVPRQQVSITDVGPTWGSQVTNKAMIALIVFFIAVVLYISLRFESKMAIAAIVAVIHDLLVTVGHLLARRASR